MSAIAVGLTLNAGYLHSQTSTPNLQTAVENAQTPQDQKIQQLQDKLEEIQKELLELKRANSAQPETHHTAPRPQKPQSLRPASAKRSRKRQQPIPPAHTRSRSPLPISPGSMATPAPKILRTQPNSSHRRYVQTSVTPTTSAIRRTTPSRIERDLSLQRSYPDGPRSRRRLPLRQRARPRFEPDRPLLHGPRRATTPALRADSGTLPTPIVMSRGQRRLPLQRAARPQRGRRHLHVLRRPVLFYQFDNWAYQPSYVSSNTPWFFNGVRVQWYPDGQVEDRTVVHQRLAVLRPVQQ